VLEGVVYSYQPFETLDYHELFDRDVDLTEGTLPENRYQEALTL